MNTTTTPFDMVVPGARRPILRALCEGWAIDAVCSSHRRQLAPPQAVGRRWIKLKKA
jgi:hypothetical protein